MAKEAQTNIFMKGSKGIGLKPFTALNAAFFKNIKEGQFSYDARKGGEHSNKRHEINVYESKQPNSKFWTKFAGRTSKLRKYESWTYSNIKINSIDIDIPNIGPKGKPFKIRFRATGADPVKQQTSATSKTEQRENSTMLFIEQAVTNPSKYTFQAGEWWKVVADKKFYSKVIKMFPLLETSVLEQESAMASGRIMPRVMKRGGWKKWNHYSRDDTGTDFMAYIVDVLNQKFHFNRNAKDTWNPADIWLVRNLQTVKGKINKAVKNVSGRENISVLNKILRQLFKSGEVVGVSLKLVTKPKQGAFWKIYNVSPPQFAAADSEKIETKFGPQSQMQLGAKEYNFPLGEIICKMNFNGGQMATQDSIINLTYKKISKFKFTVKTGAGVSKFANLKYEPTETQRAAARAGKTPVDQLAPVLDTYGIGPRAFSKDKNKGHVNNWRDYPASSEEWMEEYKDYVKMWQNIKGHVSTGVKNKKEFIESFTRQFIQNPHFANTKLMQLNFLNAIFQPKMTDKKRQELFNRMLMMAEKKSHEKHIEGADFYGPFGKLS